MRKLVLGLVMATFVVGLSLGGGKVEWNTKDLDEGLKLAKKKDLPIMIYFGADW